MERKNWTKPLQHKINDFQLIITPTISRERYNIRFFLFQHDIMILTTNDMFIIYKKTHRIHVVKQIKKHISLSSNVSMRTFQINSVSCPVYTTTSHITALDFWRFNSLRERVVHKRHVVYVVWRYDYRCTARVRRVARVLHVVKPQRRLERADVRVRHVRILREHVECHSPLLYRVIHRSRAAHRVRIYRVGAENADVTIHALRIKSPFDFIFVIRTSLSGNKT